MLTVSLCDAEPTHRTICGAPVVMIATIDPPIGLLGNVKYVGLLFYNDEPQLETWTDDGRFEKLGNGRTPFDLDLPLSGS